MGTLSLHQRLQTTHLPPGLLRGNLQQVLKAMAPCAGKGRLVHAHIFQRHLTHRSRDNENDSVG